jgi:hypothetical protein
MAAVLTNGLPDLAAFYTCKRYPNAEHDCGSFADLSLHGGFFNDVILTDRLYNYLEMVANGSQPDAHKPPRSIWFPLGTAYGCSLLLTLYSYIPIFECL